jgi:ketosteroid isomerase-like protein
MFIVCHAPFLEIVVRFRLLRLVYAYCTTEPAGTFRRFSVHPRNVFAVPRQMAADLKTHCAKSFLCSKIQSNEKTVPNQERVSTLNYPDILSRYIEATNSHDFENVKKLLHPEAIYWFTKKSCTTTEEIQNYFEQAWNTIKEEVYSATDVRWLTIDEHSAVCIYTYHYKGFSEGEFVEGQGRATNVFSKNKEGDWKLVHEHLSNF